MIMIPLEAAAIPSWVVGGAVFVLLLVVMGMVIGFGSARPHA